MIFEEKRHLHDIQNLNEIPPKDHLKTIKNHLKTIHR